MAFCVVAELCSLSHTHSKGILNLLEETHTNPTQPPSASHSRDVCNMKDLLHYDPKWHKDFYYISLPPTQTTTTTTMPPFEPPHIIRPPHKGNSRKRTGLLTVVEIGSVMLSRQINMRRRE